ncbi:ABC transporter permease [Phyllobacterium sp. YR531]|uniref:ABC transporter permease n=1 Tax=Phyllobacterium sp. YR531 TaxID=1144343 RepID=UPI00026F98A4|nr:ABC transporter permease [Phyllobacterium sp. YR531]EJN03634.1 ABC-type dipeptide/oligopeptide/nickel transport system, permease component [Phyllobacterium sp. YR531]
MSTQSKGLTAWLTTEEPASATHAAFQNAWRVWSRFASNPLGIAGLIIILLLVFIAIFVPWLAPYSPFEQNLREALVAPNSQHLFGTDELGRDILSRILWGSRITLSIVMIVSVIVAPIGLLVGCIAGYYGGWVDTILMRITELFLSFPSLILALAFVAALGPSLNNAIIAIALTQWPPIARLARAESLNLRKRDHISAVRLMGASSIRIILGHIAPLCIPSVIVRITLNMAGIILTAAGLGFLGLGAQPPSPEWGAMVSTGRRFMLDSWWVGTIPGISILFVSLAFNLVGDALRDALDPRQE